MYIPSTRKVIISRDVIFDENNTPNEIHVDQPNNLEIVEGSNEEDGDGSPNSNSGKTPRSRSKPLRLTYDEKGKQVVDGSNFALLTSFEEPSCASEAREKEEVGRRWR